MTDSFKEITGIGLLDCDCDTLVECPNGTRRKWVFFWRRCARLDRTYKVNVAQITHTRRFSVKLGRIETGKNPLRRGWASLFEDRTADFFVDEGMLDVIEIRTADGTTFKVDAASAPGWLKEIAPAEAKPE